MSFPLISHTQRLIIKLASLSLLLAAEACTGEVYRWQDTRGKTHYGDKPAQGAQSLTIADLPPSRSNAPQPAQWHRVTSVHDGDTITLDDGERVRLLGINTPEVGGFRALEPGGIVARDWLREKILGKTVKLETDATPRDKYHRLLAHVFDANGVHLNLELVKAGLATTDIYPPCLKYVDALVFAEQQAEGEKRGVWALSDHQAVPAESFGEGRREGWQRFVGTPAEVIRGSNWAGLRFKGGLEAHIPKDNLSLFPPLEFYLGRNVEVRGWISRRGSGNSVSIRHPSAMPVR
jgi:micrococcal nuclease